MIADVLITTKLTAVTSSPFSSGFARSIDSQGRQDRSMWKALAGSWKAAIGLDACDEWQRGMASLRKFSNRFMSNSSNKQGAKHPDPPVDAISVSAPDRSWFSARCTASVFTWLQRRIMKIIRLLVRVQQASHDDPSPPKCITIGNELTDSFTRGYQNCCKLMARITYAGERQRKDKGVIASNAHNAY